VKWLWTQPLAGRGFFSLAPAGAYKDRRIGLPDLAQRRHLYRFCLGHGSAAFEPLGGFPIFTPSGEYLMRADPLRAVGPRPVGLVTFPGRAFF
jgi:hypothetical protein